MDLFNGFKATLSENVSLMVVGELWAKEDWRSYTQGTYQATMDLIEKFLAGDAQTIGIFGKPTPAIEPDHTFSVRTESGIWHQGALYVNGAVYRQVNSHNGGMNHILLIDDAFAKDHGYPEGWIRLSDLQEIPKDDE